MREALASAGRFGLFGAAVLRRSGPARWREALPHTWRIFWDCLIPVLAVVFPFGMVVALQGLVIFEDFGAQRMLPSLVTTAVLRELSPVLASVLVAAQGGSACAAELGSMRLREELDATEVMAVDGVAIHATPRVLAMILACPLLDLAGSFAGVAGGYATAVLVKGEPGGVFLAELWGFTQVSDLWLGMIKTLVFGLLIGLVSTWCGWNVSGGAAGVGRAVNDTVVWSVLTFVVANYLLTSAWLGLT